MNGSVAGFLSCTTADDEYEQHRIRRLAEQIRNEYSLTTGRDLVLLHRDDPNWARHWHARVENGLDTSTFFIPIITPRYLGQPDCRRELLDFAARARELGLAELFLPIVYARTHELDDPWSADEAVAVLRRSRLENWHELRTDDERSIAQRRAVHRFAARLAAATERVRRRPRTLDVVSAVEEAIPRWGQAFALMDNAIGRMAELSGKLHGDIGDGDRRRGAAITRRAILRRYADEIMKPAREILALGSAFADDVVQLDPNILTLVRSVERNPSTAEDFVDYCCALVLSAAERLRHSAAALHEHGRVVQELAELSEILDDPVNDVAVGVRRTIDGVALISEWDRRIRATGREVPEIEDGADQSTD
jgi:hypothetical protein